MNRQLTRAQSYANLTGETVPVSLSTYNLVDQIEPVAPRASSLHNLMPGHAEVLCNKPHISAGINDVMMMHRAGQTALGRRDPKQNEQDPATEPAAVEMETFGGDENGGAGEEKSRGRWGLRAILLKVFRGCFGVK